MNLAFIALGEERGKEKEWKRDRRRRIEKKDRGRKAALRGMASFPHSCAPRYVILFRPLGTKIREAYQAE